MNNQIYENIIMLLFIFIAIFFVSSALARHLKISFIFNCFCNFTVLAFTIIKFNQEILNPADASYYYDTGLQGANNYFGTDFISNCSGLFSNQLGFDFILVFFTFSITAVLAIQIFYRVFLDFGGSKLHIGLKSLMVALIIVSIGFWGAGLNKDGLTFLGISLFCYAFKYNNIQILKICLAILILFLTRPHFGLIAAFAILFSSILSNQSNKINRILIVIVSGLTIVVLTPAIFTYIGFEEISSDAISIFVDDRASAYADTNAYINIKDLSPPLRLLSYIFRPFPWEANSALQFLASLINVAVLVIILLMYKSFKRGPTSINSQIQLCYLFFIVGGLLVLGMTTSNLGISNRQKWMVVIPLVLLLLNRAGKNHAELNSVRHRY